MNYQNTILYLSQPPAMELETQKPARFFPTEMLASTHHQEYPSDFKFQTTALPLNGRSTTVCFLGHQRGYLSPNEMSTTWETIRVDIIKIQKQNSRTIRCYFFFWKDTLTHATIWWIVKIFYIGLVPQSWNLSTQKAEARHSTNRSSQPA